MESEKVNPAGIGTYMSAAAASLGIEKHMYGYSLVESRNSEGNTYIEADALAETDVVGVI
jgi:hypothetical protein